LELIGFKYIWRRRVCRCRISIASTGTYGSDNQSLITASRRQELRIGAAEGVAEKVEGLHGTLLAAP
jgi:hypothetical protein